LTLGELSLDEVKELQGFSDKIKELNLQVNKIDTEYYNKRHQVENFKTDLRKQELTLDDSKKKLVALDEQKLRDK